MPLVMTSEASAQDAPVQIAQYPGAPYEDQNGNLWFGTVLEGVIRYDGEEFVCFTTEDGLASNMIRDILEADDGTLYFATGGGLVQYDGEACTVIADYEPIKITSGWSEFGQHRDLWDVHIDTKGILWIATMDGVFKHNGEVFERFPMPEVAQEGEYLFTSKMVSVIYEDRNGDLWFGTDGAGAIRYDGTSFIVYTMEANGLSSDNVSEIFQDSHGEYWFGTANGGISHYDGATFTTHLRSKEFSKHHGWGRYFAIHEDRKGDIWLGAAYEGGGVYRYNGESFEYLSTQQGLGNGGVPSIREDRSGNLWFGTTAGVYHFDGKRFINFSKTNPQPPAPREAASTSTNGQLADLVSIEDWASETIDLPPDFAPDMPKGVEELRFAPGWRDPESDSFWSYAIVMWIDEPIADSQRVTELLEIYYDGLMSVFAHKEFGEVSIKPAQVLTQRIAPNKFKARMHLIDAFATFEPIELFVRVETAAISESRSTVRIRVSSQPTEHQIWESMDTAILDILEN